MGAALFVEFNDTKKGMISMNLIEVLNSRGPVWKGFLEDYAHIAHNKLNPLVDAKSDTRYYIQIVHDNIEYVIHFRCYGCSRGKRRDTIINQFDFDFLDGGQADDVQSVVKEATSVQKLE